jgi:hypothetical protein
MRQYDSRDWFKCDNCEHIFTKAPVVDIKSASVG